MVGGRNVAVVAMIALLWAGAVLAQAVSFPKSRLELVTKNGTHHAISVELAQSPEQLSQGLMFRRDLPAGTGMLFDFGTSKPVSMWMKNTLVPLDMLFMDRGGRVVYVEEFAVPGSLQPRGPGEPVLGVLELPAGTARRLGLAPGDRVEHEMFRHGR
ncbi:MAG: DUF192 domain-containing protein [Magnetospirillum sp.]|nr:DUF192 domain-containing protein [Magnetospirillum sp.]